MCCFDRVRNRELVGKHEMVTSWCPRRATTVARLRAYYVLSVLGGRTDRRVACHSHFHALGIYWPVSAAWRYISSVAVSTRPRAAPSSTALQAVDAAVVTVERAMVHLRQNQARRSLARALERELGQPIAPVRCAVIDAFEEVARGAGQATSVGDIAECLGVDPSRASRMVAAAIRAGDVVRVASQADGRRIGLALTEQGRSLAGVTHTVRRQAFADRMRDWTTSERREFARLLERFTQQRPADSDPGLPTTTATPQSDADGPSAATAVGLTAGAVTKVKPARHWVAEQSSTPRPDTT